MRLYDARARCLDTFVIQRASVRVTRCLIELVRRIYTVYVICFIATEMCLAECNMMRMMGTFLADRLDNGMNGQSDGLVN